MKNRCQRKADKKYHLYGGRGIQVCKRWTDFEKFYEDMGPKPDPYYSIERKNGNKNYTPGNCYWATIQQQNRNTSRNRYVQYKGKRVAVPEALDMGGGMNVTPHIVYKRLRMGWNEKRAIETPRSDFHVRVRGTA